MSDGVQLSARIRVPTSTADDAFTTVLEVTPYRLRDVSAARDRRNHEWFAQSGFAAVKVDMRGTGDSLGTAGAMLDERDVDDTLAAMDWIGRQAWSNGRVVLFGISWGAIHAMLVAARRPAAVSAVVAVSYYTDAFSSGLCYKGGCITTEMAGWSGAVLGYHTRPADPVVMRAGWRENWDERASAAVPDAIRLLSKPYRSEFWASRRLDPVRIDCPVLSICGVMDGNFATAVFDFASQQKTALILGPWAHRWPDLAVPAPGLDMLPLVRDWLFHYAERRATVEPPIAVGESWIWRQEARSARPYWSHSAGHWLRTRAPLSDLAASTIFYLGRGALVSRPEPGLDLTIRYRGIAGWNSGELMPAFNAGPEAELAGEQSQDDSRSMCFDGSPVDAPMMICGRPVIDLVLQSSVPTAQICARLCEVRPNGEAVRISYGVANLCLIDEASPAELKPGTRYRITLQLDFLCYKITFGNRLRLAISNSYWPLIWPTRDAGEQRLFAEDCRLTLPLMDGSIEVFDPKAFALGASRELAGRLELAAPRRERSRSYHPFTGSAALDISDHHGRYLIDDDPIAFESRMHECHTVEERNPANASSDIFWAWQFDRDDRRARSEARLSMTSTATSFSVAYTVRRWDGDAELAPVSGSETFHRDYH